MLLLTAGVALLALVFADVIETTLGGPSAGPLTRALSAAAFRLARAVRGVGGRWVHRYAGPVALTLVASAWIVLHWVAWTLIFLGDPRSVIVSATGAPASQIETAAYVGAMLSTLGSSRSEAGNGVWDLVSAVVALNGMVMLTLSITFVMNITRTVTAGHSFAVLFDALDPRHPGHAETLRGRLAEVGALFAAYPLAHTFSTARRERRVVPAIAAFVERALDETTLETFRPVLALLPGVDVTGDVAAVKASVHRWAARHTLGDHTRRS